MPETERSSGVTDPGTVGRGSSLRLRAPFSAESLGAVYGDQSASTQGPAPCSLETKGGSRAESWGCFVGSHRYRCLVPGARGRLFHQEVSACSPGGDAAPVGFILLGRWSSGRSSGRFCASSLCPPTGTSARPPSRSRSHGPRACCLVLDPVASLSS